MFEVMLSERIGKIEEKLEEDWSASKLRELRDDVHALKLDIIQMKNMIATYKHRTEYGENDLAILKSEKSVDKYMKLVCVFGCIGLTICSISEIIGVVRAKDKK